MGKRRAATAPVASSEVATQVPHGEFITKLQQSTLLRDARAAVLSGKGQLGGLWASGLAFFLSAWQTEQGGGVTLLVTSTLEEADDLVDSLALFSNVETLTFPAWESLFADESEPDGEILGLRLEAATRLSEDDGGHPRFVVAPVQAILQPLPALEELRGSRLSLTTETDYVVADLTERLVTAGFRHVPLVEQGGEFSQRGDILDFFPYQQEHPIRLEFFGDTLDSIRPFHAENQRSLAGGGLRELDCFLPPRDLVLRDCIRKQEDVLLPDLLGEGTTIFLIEPENLRERLDKILHNVVGEDADRVSGWVDARLQAHTLAEVHSLPLPPSPHGVNVDFRSVERHRGGDLAEVCGGLKGRLEGGTRLVVYCENDAEQQRFAEILADNGLAVDDRLQLAVGSLQHGFEAPALATAFLTTRELFNRSTLRRSRRKSRAGRAIQSFLELSPGDYVVHLAHGIARFLGMESVEKDNVLQEFLVLEFRNQVKVYVPVSKTDLVQKYIGPGDRPPTLDKVGGVSWAKKKDQVEEALADLASELLDVQAMRAERCGIAYPEDSEWQRAFEAAFPFDDTPDQVDVTEVIKRDMKSPRPMDRLICGDVGYGKTELSMRAAFKAVDGGKQVGILVPTTVLAQQHYRTFRERMAEFPITIEVVSRFRTKKQQREVLEAVAAGKIDILIGTHRILSKDVTFRDLGLVIIDEEQRFGVAHKEKLKKLRSTVDVLTLTATPIPRTLHMSLLGIKDISSLSTPPEGRNPVMTRVMRFSEASFRDIAIRELNRDGQIYFVHNRIHDIGIVKTRLEQIVPEARIAVAHGRMNEHELEEIMFSFVEGEKDLLISTTIIESGIDIPNVNTIIIDEADIYGLADLHQLRGRVGRYKHQAYCYLLLPEDRPINDDARKRLQALVEYSDLGSGFQIAMRDLELRGAGNILGSAQSGHIALVGYDMYCRLLEQSVRRLKDQPLAEPVQVEVDFKFKAYIPEDLIPRDGARLELYRRISQAGSDEEIVDLREEIKDRYGNLPAAVESLLDIQRLRVFCAGFGVDYIGRDGHHLLLRGRQERMERILATCTARLAVLDSKTVAVPVTSSPTPSGSLMDQEMFGFALEWFCTSSFPKPLRARRRQRRVFQ